MTVDEVEVEEHGWTGGYPIKQLDEVPVRKGDPTKVVNISGALDQDVRKNLVELLEEYKDIFT